MLFIIASALLATVLADSFRYQLGTTPIAYKNNKQFFKSTGAGRLVTVNLGAEKCDAPTAAKPCGWGLHRTVYEQPKGKTFHSAGQRNAFGLKAAKKVQGFWAKASKADDLPGDLITLEKDLRAEYGVNQLRLKTPKKIENGVFVGSSPSYITGHVDLNNGGNFGACFRLFDNTPADRPNSFDLVATGKFAKGKPTSIKSDVVFGFWREGVVGKMTEKAADKFYKGSKMVPTVDAVADDVNAVKAVLGNRAKFGLDGIQQRFAQPVFGLKSEDILDDAAGTKFFNKEETADRRAALWPLVYHEADETSNDRVRQACTIVNGECVFRPVAYVSAVPCQNTRTRSVNQRVRSYFN